MEEHTVPVNLQPRQMVVRYTSRSGRRRFHGGKDLKQSQSYPDQLLGFCLAVLFRFIQIQFKRTKIPWLVSRDPALRFGVALAKARTANQDVVKRDAFRFLRAAKKSSNAFSSSPRANKTWVDALKLGSVVEFLSCN